MLQFASPLAACALAVATLAGPVQAASVIVNGTFDDNSTGWTGTYATRNADPWIDTGSYYFPGAGPSHQIWQDYTLTAEERARAAAGTFGYSLSADTFGWHGQRDYSILAVSFLDGNAMELGHAAIDTRDVYPDTGMPWNLFIHAGGTYFQERSGIVPVDTATLHFSIDSVRVGGGTNNDGYVDNAFFAFEDVPPPAPVPLPGSLPLLGAGLIAAGALRLGWKKR